MGRDSTIVNTDTLGDVIFRLEVDVETGKQTIVEWLVACHMQIHYLPLSLLPYNLNGGKHDQREISTLVNNYFSQALYQTYISAKNDAWTV